jgi:hypothetical protein
MILWSILSTNAWKYMQLIGCLRTDCRYISFVLIFIMLLCGNAQAQHLWWNLEKQNDAACVYGEITVLATNPGIYFCGANWHPGKPAGGYCGIQHNAPKERRTIFSIWDTSPDLHPKITAADPKTVHNRFGGEGEGGHTHMLWDWKEGETFQFFVQKRTTQNPDEIDACYYIFDSTKKKWLHVATITCPTGGENSVATIGGGLNSFLENFLGTDREVPKVALYRLWIGPAIENMKCLTRAVGDGTWGQLHDAYFLAEGDSQKLNAEFSKLEKEFGKPIYGEKGKELAPFSNKPLPDAIQMTIAQIGYLGRNGLQSSNSP